MGKDIFHHAPVFSKGKRSVLAAKVVFVLLTIFFMANLSALIDSILHPEIPYFDEEHLIMGGATALVTALLFVLIALYNKSVRRSHLLFSTVLDSFHDEVMIIEAGTFRIVGGNAPFFSKFGRGRADVAGKTCYEVTHDRKDPCTPPHDLCPVIDAEKTGSFSAAEHIHFDGKGEIIHEEISVAPVRDETGAITHFVHIARDITERKRAEEEVRRLNEELELQVADRTARLLDAQEELVRKEKLSTLGQLAGSLGHELRNPLGVINNAVYFLRTVLPDTDETVREYLEVIKAEVDTSLRIISDLLDFSRTKMPHTMPVSVNDLITKSLAKSTIPGNISVARSVPDILPDLRLDPFQMHQVFQNLITNAVQAMPDGGALRISAGTLQGPEASPHALSPADDARDPQQPAAEQGTGNVEPSQEYLEISVADTGEGISPENMKKIFLPLYTTKARGIGLGLVVAKKLVEMNGGRILVHSEPGKGTTFRLFFPVAGRS